MSARAWLAAVLSLLAAMALPAEARTLHHPSRAKVQPRAFRSCAGLVGYARRHFAATHGVPEPTVTPVVEPGARAPGTPAPTATSAPQTSGGSATSTFSTTNNQEEGVDEPDVVKTDGSTIFALSNGKLIAVSVTGGGAP